MKDLFQEITETVKNESKKEHKQIGYPTLIKLAHRTIVFLLEAKELTNSQRQIIYKLILCTDIQGTPGNDYANEYVKQHDNNTCTYKIARELVIKFPGNTFDFLYKFMNWYYFDHYLVEKAAEEIIKLAPVRGLKLALTFAQPGCRASTEQMQWQYWKQLKAIKRLSSKTLINVICNSSFSLRLRKDAIGVMRERNLVNKSRRPDYYNYLFDHVILPATNSVESEELFEKHRTELVRLVKEVKDRKKKIQ